MYEVYTLLKGKLACRPGFHPLLYVCKYLQDGKSETQNVSDPKNFRQGIFNLNYILFFRIEEFIFKTIHKYASNSKFKLPRTWVILRGDPIASSDVCGHLSPTIGEHNLDMNSHKHTHTYFYLKIKQGTVRGHENQCPRDLSPSGGVILLETPKISHAFLWLGIQDCYISNQVQKSIARQSSLCFFW